MFLLGNGAISWSSRKQQTPAQNTTEAEYMAMTDAANQAKWYRSIPSELGYTINAPIPIHGDNKGAIDLALNPVTGRRSKHIDIKHHVIREYIERDEMNSHSFVRLLQRWSQMALPSLYLAHSYSSSTRTWVLVIHKLLDHGGMLRACTR